MQDLCGDFLMHIRLEVSGDVQVARDLLRFGDRGADLSPAYRVIGDDFLQLEERQFASEGSYASGGWAPLAQSTLTRKARLGLDMRILHATLRLRDSLTRQGAADSIRRITSDEVVLGTSVPYASFHQTGGERLPRRRPVELREADRRRWVKVIQRFLVTGQTAGAPGL